MLNEKAEKIKNVLFEKTEQNLEKYRDFHFGEFIEKPNQCGYCLLYTSDAADD